MSQFENLLIKTFGEHEPKEIEELILDDFWKNKDSFITEEKTVLEKYTNLIHLSLNNIGLKSLGNLPNINGLYMLSLNNNKLNGDDFDLLKGLYPGLNKLKISGNNIEKIENLEKLKDLKLRKIEVKDNPFCVKNSNYKDMLFKMLPTLESIDHENNEGKEVISTDYHNEEEEEEDEDVEYNDEDDDDEEEEKNKYEEVDDYEDNEEESEEEDENKKTKKGKYEEKKKKKDGDEEEEENEDGDNDD